MLTSNEAILKQWKKYCENLYSDHTKDKKRSWEKLETKKENPRSNGSTRKTVESVQRKGKTVWGGNDLWKR